MRGLEYITKALVETQGPEVKQVWRNSSLKTAAGKVLEKSQTVVQDVASNQSSLPKAMVDKTVMMARQASTVVSTLKTSVPPMSTPFTNSSAEDLNLSSDFSKALGVNEEQFEEMFEEEKGTVPPKTAPRGKKPPSDTILKDILENTKTKKIS